MFDVLIISDSLKARDIDHELLIDNHRSGSRQCKLLESRHSSIYPSKRELTGIVTRFPCFLWGSYETYGSVTQLSIWY